MNRSFWLTLLFALLLGACSQNAGYTGLVGKLKSDCIADNPDGIHCKLVANFQNFIVDSFERNDVIDDQAPTDFGWRKIINDNGNIITGKAGRFVDAEIFSDQEMGPASDGGHALYFWGRQGRSIHNIYLITKTFNIRNLVNGQTVIISFDYLTMSLEDDEYLKLEVCNDSAENCGVGMDISVDGLNTSAWKTVFEVGPNAVGANLNGLNHQLNDWQSERVVLFLEDFQKNEFIFRFNARMDEGFIDNQMANGLTDGVAIDNVRATAYEMEDGVVEDFQDDPQQILDVRDL